MNKNLVAAYDNLLLAAERLKTDEVHFEGRLIEAVEQVHKARVEARIQEELETKVKVKEGPVFVYVKPDEDKLAPVAIGGSFLLAACSLFLYLLF